MTCRACEDGELYAGTRPYQVDKLVCRDCQRSPAVQLRVLLEFARDRGVAFEPAWDFAWSRIRWPHDTPHRREWKAILDTAKSKKVWRDCFENRPASQRERTLAHLQLAA